jgi:hypothetical protein
VEKNEAHFADAGGFVSPNGVSYIGVSKQKLGEAAACAVKRTNLDMRVAKRAQRSGSSFVGVAHQGFTPAGLGAVLLEHGQALLKCCFPSHPAVPVSLRRC